MHELSLCQAIGDAVLKHAGDRAVRTIHLRIGKLRQIVPDTLLCCWALVSEDTELAGSELEIDSVPAAIRCMDCDRNQILTEAVFICTSCGGQKVEIVTGEEFLITSLDVAEA